MASSADSFRVFFSMASLLRHWITELIKDFEEYGPASFSRSFRNQGDRKEDHMDIHDLFPCTSRMETTLFTNCLSLNEDEFMDDCFDEKYTQRFKKPNDPTPLPVQGTIDLNNSSRRTGNSSDGTGANGNNPLDDIEDESDKEYPLGSDNDEEGDKVDPIGTPCDDHIPFNYDADGMGDDDDDFTAR